MNTSAAIRVKQTRTNIGNYFFSVHVIKRNSRTGRFKVVFWSVFDDKATGSQQDATDQQDATEEAGVDMGAPRHEFFRLLIPAVLQNSGLLRATKGGSYAFACNMGNLEGYFALGNMVATMLVQAGQRCEIFSTSTVDFILGKPFEWDEDVVEELEMDKAVALKAVR